MRSRAAQTKLVELSQREPELIPINRSHQWTTEEVRSDMVLIKGGEFSRPGLFLKRARRGESHEEVKHRGYRVRVAPFYMDKYEVTYEAYCRFLNDGNEKYATGGTQRNENGCFAPPRPEMARLPMRGANYFHAKAYAQWAGKRLPTEAEWEFAHGGSQGRTYPWGEEKPDKTRANFGPALKGLKPVGSLPNGQTPEGVFDLAGNIGEWCADYYDEDYYRNTSEEVIENPRGPKNGYLRVQRLGCQCRHATAEDLRGNLRCSASPFRAAPCVGFRCVLTK